MHTTVCMFMGTHMHQKCKFGIIYNFSCPINKGNEGWRDGGGVLAVHIMLRYTAKWQNVNVCEIWVVGTWASVILFSVLFYLIKVLQNFLKV